MALFLILPVFATIARFLIRLRSGRWHRASWDDGFVLAATICLFTEGTMTLVCRDQLFVLEIYYLDPWNSVLSSDISLPTLNGKILAANCLVWTSIFAIKMSFMALFYGLIWNISRRLKWYYVFVVVLTTLTWFLIILQVIIESTILCPAFADEACMFYSHHHHCKTGTDHKRRQMPSHWRICASCKTMASSRL